MSAASFGMRSTSRMPTGGRQSQSPTTTLRAEESEETEFPPSTAFPPSSSTSSTTLASSLHHGGSTVMRVNKSAAISVNAAGAPIAKRHPKTPSVNAASAVDNTPPTCCDVAQTPIAVPLWVGANQGLKTLTCSGYAKLCATPFTPHAINSNAGSEASAKSATAVALKTYPATSIFFAPRRSPREGNTSWPTAYSPRNALSMPAIAPVLSPSASCMGALTTLNGLRTK
mmetsp:Transcript_5798/g.23481  ORF Transcript_5798/g.23481 Transcript_5798/m.23481 type:complete len:228 (-) Transcript_5798:336-1019(-)